MVKVINTHEEFTAPYIELVLFQESDILTVSGDLDLPDIDIDD